MQTRYPARVGVRRVQSLPSKAIYYCQYNYSQSKELQNKRRINLQVTGDIIIRIYNNEKCDLHLILFKALYGVRPCNEFCT